MQFGIFLYDGVEPIDLATFGVLSMARRIRPDIEICTIAPRQGVTRLVNGLRVIADYDFQTAPKLDVLIVTGGPGWMAQSQSPETLAFIRDSAAEFPVVSVCTGGMILAASGVLIGRSDKVSARLDQGLLAAAARKLGTRNTTEVVQAALAAPDPFVEWLLSDKDRLPADFELAV